MVTHTVERLVGPWYVRMLQPSMWATFGAKQVRGGLAKLKKLAEQPTPAPVPRQRKAAEVPTEERAAQ